MWGVVCIKKGIGAEVMLTTPTLRKMMKLFTVFSLGFSVVLLTNAGAIAHSLSPFPERLAQATSSYSTADLVKARNFARQKIEFQNGGLNRYRADAAMHGPISQAPVVENPDGTLTFKFFGGRPAYTTPTVESVVTIDPKTWTINVNYNGPVRR
jgi:hypothetical protein